MLQATMKSVTQFGSWAELSALFRLESQIFGVIAPHLLG